MRPTRFSCLLLFSRFSEKKLDKNLLCIQFHFFTMRDGFIWDLLMTEKGSIRILRNYGFPSSRKNFYKLHGTQVCESNNHISIQAKYIRGNIPKFHVSQGMP